MSQSNGECKLIISKTEPVDHMINIINVYAPTTERVKENKAEVEKMYQDIVNQMNILKKNKSSVIFIAGDFNAKVGKRRDDEECMGKYSAGERNDSGAVSYTHLTLPTKA